MVSCSAMRIAVLSGRLSGGVFSAFALAALICLCWVCCWRLRRYLGSLTGQPSTLSLVGVPTYAYNQQQPQPTPSLWALRTTQQRPYHISEEGAAVEMSSTATQQPPSYTASATDSSQQPGSSASSAANQPTCPSQPAPFTSYSQPAPPSFAQQTQYPYGQPYVPQRMYSPAAMPGAVGGGGYGLGSMAAAGVGGLLLGELLGGGIGGGLGGGGFDGTGLGDTAFDGGDVGGGGGMGGRGGDGI